MEVNFTIERDPKPFAGQQRAIETLDRSLLVSAGAGSGKTWVLTERYLEILSKGYRPSQIVAITFTEKAAGEMKTRIRSAIQKMINKASDDHEKLYWEQCEREVKHSIVTTIHGFCSRVLRTNPVEIGLDPFFNVLDGTEAKLLLRDVTWQTVRDYMEEGKEGAARLYKQFPDTEELVGVVSAIYTNLRTLNQTPQDMLATTERELAKRQENFTEALDRLITHTEKMNEVFADIKAKAKKPAAYFEKYERWMAHFQEAIPLLRASDAVMNEEISAKFEAMEASKWRKSGTEQFKEMTDMLREEYLPDLSNLFISEEYVPLLRSLATLIGITDRNYRQAKEKRQSVDFNDLETLAAKLLAKQPSVRNKWQQRLEFLMVDEFQDTNALQKSIIDHLTAQGDKVKLFVVGDGKQSIYKFRGADVQVFYDIEKEIVAKGGETVSLAMNFRTQSPVIAYINSLFAELMETKDHPSSSYATVYEALEAHRQVEREDQAIEMIVTTEEGEEHTEKKDEDVHWVEVEAESLARRMKQIVTEGERVIWDKNDDGEEAPRSATYGDFAVLLAARSQMHLYESVFQDYQIPYVVVGGRSFYQKQEILDVANVLKLIQNQDDELALLGFLRSPFVHVKDTTLFWLTRGQSLTKAFHRLKEKPAEVEMREWEKFQLAQQWVKKWLLYRNSVSIHELLTMILDDTGYLGMLIAGYQGEQKVSNVEKLLQLARSQFDEQGKLLYDLVHYIDLMQAEGIQEEEASVVEDRGDAVVIMSIHSSKGLEFPIVCIPEMKKDFLKKGGSSERTYFHPDKGLGLKLIDTNYGNGFHEELRTIEQQKETEEAKRLLYVAMTRARDHLILVGSKISKGTKDTWLTWTLHHLGFEDFDCLNDQRDDCEQLRMIHASELPAYDKGHLAKTTTWQTWLNSDHVTDKDLPELPLLPRGEDYRWNDPLQQRNELPTLSASAMMLFERCPRYFYLQYIEGMYGLDALLGEDDDQERAGFLSAVERGTIVHHLTEHVGAEDLETIDWYDLIEEQVLQVVQEPEVTLCDEDRKLLTSYMKSYESFMSQIGDASYENEKTLYLLWDDQPLYGQVDRIQYHDDGTVSIYDFKTNKITETRSVGKVVQPYLLQGYFYTELVEQVLKKDVVKMEFVFLHSGESYAISLDQKSRAEARQKITDIISYVQQHHNIEDYRCCTNPSCACKLID
ncbi:UvrD-helicase domain-containing protein [Desertibacillus haloalkaliphilus]|uniref:UvrD-helicase domain-containing protein n=1 Tax=Desertibacillus haloalkaliphilus TaxID=1328930 RepID=UPI001C26C1E6|nr:UvrD-helicase domain-containing protein [Desertibacillus haloalkaliphilus]MBU8907579.1 UvrD-helicase domain-containing protein [Desertibacillus haloalkaliphilus]